MGCNKSKHKDIIQTGGRSVSKTNKDQGSRQRNMTSSSAANNGESEEIKPAMKKDEEVTRKNIRKKKHVTFEKQDEKEPIPDNEKLIAVDDFEESEDERFYSADEEISIRREKQSDQNQPRLNQN